MTPDRIKNMRTMLINYAQQNTQWESVTEWSIPGLFAICRSPIFLAQNGAAAVTELRKNFPLFAPFLRN